VLRRIFLLENPVTGEKYIIIQAVGIEILEGTCYTKGWDSAVIIGTGYVLDNGGVGV
jgi:hypothetical protein